MITRNWGNKAGTLALVTLMGLPVALAQTGQTGTQRTGTTTGTSSQTLTGSGTQTARQNANRGIPPALINRLDGLTTQERDTLSRVMQRLSPDEQRVMVKALSSGRNPRNTDNTRSNPRSRRNNTGIGQGSTSRTGTATGSSSNMTGSTGGNSSSSGTIGGSNLP